MTTGINKRRKTYMNEENIEDDSWSRYLVVTGKDEKLARLSPFAIDKYFVGQIGLCIIKRLKEGNYLVEVGRPFHSETLLKCTSIQGCPVEVTRHRTLNSSRGIVRCRDLERCSPDEIAQECASQGVTEVKRFTFKKNGQILQSNTYLFTFNRPQLPLDVKLGYLRCKVTHYIPAPLRCFHCQRFGHHKANCKRVLETCARCASEGHGDVNCTKTLKCTNCNGGHPAFSKACPRYKDEYEVQKIRIMEKMSFFDAKKQYEQRYGLRLDESYAAIVAKKLSNPKPKMVNMACQVDFTIIPNSLPEKRPSRVDPPATPNPGKRPPQGKTPAHHSEARPPQKNTKASHSGQSPAQNKPKAKQPGHDSVESNQALKTKKKRATSSSPRPHQSGEGEHHSRSRSVARTDSTDTSNKFSVLGGEEEMDVLPASGKRPISSTPPKDRDKKARIPITAPT
jgi:hypothetical protein